MYSNSTSGKNTHALEKFITAFYDGVGESDREFRQFLSKQKKINLGLNAGDTVSVPILGELSVDDSVLDEALETTVGDFSIGKKTCVVDEFGLKMKYTDRIKSIAELPIEDIFRKKLGKHAARKLDLVAFKRVFEVANVVASPKSGTSTVELDFATNGTATTANSGVRLTVAHVLQISTYMKAHDFPLRDGKYWAIGSPTALANLKNELVNVIKFTTPGIEQFYRGIVGEVHGVVFIEQTNVATNDVYFCGDEIGAEVIVRPEMIYVGNEEDIGRKLEMGWKAILGFTSFADNRIVKFSGASGSMLNV